jgi:hypothetical protein
MSVGVQSDPTELSATPKQRLGRGSAQGDPKQRLGRGFAQEWPLSRHATLRCVFVKQRVGLFHNDSRYLQ